MARPQEQLASALATLKQFQDQGKVAIRSKNLSRSDRERLMRAGFIARVIKGWYIPTRPDAADAGESTSWYASFWAFCADYLNARLDDKWFLSPEQSVLIQVGNHAVPDQLLVRSPNGSNNAISLPYDTSILEIKAALPPPDQLAVAEGLRLLRLPYALVNAGPRLYINYPNDARAALAQIRDASELLDLLLEDGRSTIAGRLAGALRSIGRERFARDIVRSMSAAGHIITVSNPFEDELSFSFPPHQRSPHVNRLHAFWRSLRVHVIEAFPEPPGIPDDNQAYLTRVDEIYRSDAYHSLSIEGYRVSEQLIDQVRRGDWHPAHNDADGAQRDAMAARGYWLAFEAVKQSVAKVLDNVNAGDVADEDHSDWYRALFGPSVEAGVLSATDLAGYRNAQVYIRNSRHVPVNREALLDCMPALFEHLRLEEHPAVRAALGHWVFVYFHPYMDGNGRMARFLMNVMLASGGYPWTVIPVERRSDYMAALEAASVGGDIRPLAKFLAGLVRQSLSAMQ